MERRENSEELSLVEGKRDASQPSRDAGFAEELGNRGKRTIRRDEAAERAQRFAGTVAA